MSICYLDSSALTKYYVTEPGSTWVRQLIEAQDPVSGEFLQVLSVAEITRVEVAASLAVIERVGRIRRTVREREYRRFIHQLTTRYTIIPIITNDYESAANLIQSYPLRAYDAIQLAVALRYQQIVASFQMRIVFISGDKTLNSAAQAEGLSVDNPFNHAVPQDSV